MGEVGCNIVHVGQSEFKSATKVFAAKRLKLGPALLAYEGGFLSIESGEATAVMRATGEWHGRATFSPSVLRALATVPPAQDPITIAYADGHLRIASMIIPCQWSTVSQAFIHDLENPSLLDLLAMERSVSRGEINGTELGKKIRGARQKVERRVKNAAAQLEELGVSEHDLRALIETQVLSRCEKAPASPR